MNNYCLRNWRLVKTGIHSSKNYWKLNDWPFCILRQTNFVRFFKVRSLIKTRYGPCMELSPERVTTTKELSGQKLRKFSCEFCLEPFWCDYTTRDVTYKSRKMIDTPSIWIFCFVLWNFESLSLVIGYNQSDASIGWYHFLSGMTLYFNDPLGNSSIHNLHFHHPIGIHIIWSILCHAYLGTI